MKTMAKPSKLAHDVTKAALEVANLADPNDKDFPKMDFIASAMRSLLEQEAYWRNAVKNADGFNNDSGYCNFHCDNLGREHAPNCPWQLAQQLDA